MYVLYKTYIYSNHRSSAFWITEESEPYGIKECTEMNFKRWKNNSEEHWLEHTAWQDVQYYAIIIHLGCSMKPKVYLEAKKSGPNQSPRILFNIHNNSFLFNSSST